MTWPPHIPVVASLSGAGLLLLCLPLPLLRTAAYILLAYAFSPCNSSLWFAALAATPLVPQTLLPLTFPSPGLRRHARPQHTDLLPHHHSSACSCTRTVVLPCLWPTVCLTHSPHYTPLNIGFTCAVRAGRGRGSGTARLPVPCNAPVGTPTPHTHRQAACLGSHTCPTTTTSPPIHLQACPVSSVPAHPHL